MKRISVVIGVYGDERWAILADRAARSVPVRSDVEVIIHRECTRAEARNAGALLASGKRLVFLDADDRLGPGFIDLVVEPEDVLQPKTVFRDGGVGSAPRWIEPREDFLMGNHIVIGAPVNRELFMDSGGFEEYPIAEDWALWLKLRAMGATFGRTEATYIVNVNHRGVNAQPDMGVYDEIRNRFK